MTIRRILAILMLIVTTQLVSQAQSNQFRDSRAHLGVGIGLFTYHGPIDLLQPRSRVNFVREHDPALVFLGSFPVVRDLFFFRGMIVFTSFSTKDVRKLVGSCIKDFLTTPLFRFESQIVLTFLRASYHR